MKHYLHRIVRQLTESGALTHLLPYEARMSARRG